MRQQIRLLASEIARLSRADLGPEQFYPEFLGRVVSALAAVGGAVWVLSDGRRLELACQVNLQDASLPETPEGQLGHSRLLARVLAGGEGLLVPSHAEGENGQGTNPTEFLLVLAPLRTELEAAGVVEIFQRPDAAPDVQRGYLRFVLQMCDLASDFLKSRQLRHFSDRQVLWAQLEEYAHQVHASLDPRQTAYTIVNEGRRLIECDRVSVAISNGRKCTIEAVSGQDVLEKRSNSVRLLGKLATAAVATGEPIWYTGDTAHMAPQVEQVVQQYVDETHTKAVGVLPLRRATADREGSDDAEEASPPVGALIVERIEDSRLAPAMMQRVDVVCRHGALALANAVEHRRLFLMPLWQALGRVRWVVRARTLPKTVAVLTVVAAVTAWLLFWPAELEIQTKGTLQPVVQREVFVGIDGRVEEVLVDHGALVHGPDPQTAASGTLLAVLRNNELEEEIARVEGERLTVAQQIVSIGRSLLEEKRDVQDRNRLSAQLAELKQDLENLNIQWGVLRQKHKELTIYSPANGQVVTWDVRNVLSQRPVQRGQRLLRIADIDGPWQLELHMPEDRMGHVVRAQQELREGLRRQLADKLQEELGEASDEQRDAEVSRILDEPSHRELRSLLGEEVQDRLRVSFVLATDPGARYEGTIQEIEASADVRGQEGNTVLIKVQIDKAQLPPRLMPGAEVSAKVDCGRCSVGYDLLHDVFAWVQRLWFRF